MIGQATVYHVQTSKALGAHDNDETTKALMLISLATPTVYNLEENYILRSLNSFSISFMIA